MNPVIQPSAQQPQEVHLSDYINVIMRRRRTFLVAFLVVFAGVALYTFAVRPVYQAGATLHVKDDKGGGVLGELSLLSSSTPIDAEIEILKSRTIAEQVVRNLHLDWRVDDASDGLACKVLEFVSTAKEPSYRVTLTAGDGYTVSDDDGRVIGGGRSNELLKTPELTLMLQIQGKQGDSCELTLLNFNGTVAAMRSGVKAMEVGKKTGIIGVTYNHTDPRLAADVVNTLASVYLDRSVASKSEEANRTVTFVEEQLKEVRDQLNKAEGDLQGYKSRTGVMQLDAEAQELIKNVSDIEKQRAAVSLQKKQLEFALASLKESRGRGKTYTPAAMADDPLLAGMATKLTELEVQKRALLGENTQEHPAVKDVQAQIDELQRKIQATYETGIRNAARQEAGIDQRMATYEGELRNLPLAERELARHMRLVKVDADIYTMLLQKHEEARISKASTISNISIVDPAIIPDRPVKPQKGKNLLLGLLVGCMFGVGLAFFQDYLDDTIKDPDEAKRIFGYPLLATVPHIGRNGGRDGIANVIICHDNPRSPAAEALRSLRTAIHFSAVSKDKRILLVTSSFPGEGKSTVSSNLATTIAQTGARVLLIDCDMRLSTLHAKLQVEKVPGLSEVLAGDTSCADAVQETRVSNLFLLAAGTTPPNPSELLGSIAMSDLLERLRGEYDQLIIDAPPVLAVTDAPVLTSLADLVLVVMETGRVPGKAASRVRELLGNVQAPVAGLVVNNKTGSDAAYGYGYGYGHYGEDEKATAAVKPWWKRFFKSQG